MKDPIDPIERETLPQPPQRDVSAWFALAGMVGIAFVAVLALVVSRNDPDNSDELAFTDRPSMTMMDQCNAHAEQARAAGEIAAAPTVSDDDPNLAGISHENRYSSSARAAYRDCMIGIRAGS